MDAKEMAKFRLKRLYEEIDKQDELLVQLMSRRKSLVRQIEEAVAAPFVPMIGSASAEELIARYAELGIKRGGSGNELKLIINGVYLPGILECRTEKGPNGESLLHLVVRQREKPKRFDAE